MSTLLLAAAAFVGLHSGIAGSPLRGVLARMLGDRGYQGAFSLASIGGIWWLVRSYRQAYADDNTLLWHLGVGPLHAAAPVMLLALFLAVIGLLSPNPASVGQERLLQRVPEARGIQRITRHPFLWGVIVWSTFHLTANGDAASVVLFGTFLAVAFTGTFSIDRKRARVFGETWAQYAATTSNVPFAAILSGRNRLALRELGAVRVVVALAVFAAVVALHAKLFGAYPMPGMDD